MSRPPDSAWVLSSFARPTQILSYRPDLRLCTAAGRSDRRHGARARGSRLSGRTRWPWNGHRITEYHPRPIPAGFHSDIKGETLHVETITRESASPAGDARTELGRFFQLAGDLVTGDVEMPVFSPAVDEAWHQLLDDPQAHAGFCLEHAGIVLGHLRKAGSGPVEWISLYEKAYGPLPDVWFTDASGAVNEELKAAYQKTGTVVTSWDCHPIPPDPDAQPSRRHRTNCQ